MNTPCSELLQLRTFVQIWRCRWVFCDETTHPEKTQFFHHGILPSLKLSVRSDCIVRFARLTDHIPGVFFFFFINNTISPTCYSVVAGAVKNHKYGVFMPNHPKKSHTKLTPFFNVKMKQCSPAMNTKQTMLQSTKTITLIRCQSLRFTCFLL